jgi:hypothetical protein
MQRLRSRMRGGVVVSNGVSYPSLASGAKVAVVGDSITQNANFATSTKLSNRAYSILEWAMRDWGSLRKNIWYDATATDGMSYNALFRGSNFGYSGYSAAGIETAIGDAVLNLAPDLVILKCGTNTGTAEETPAATTFAAIERMVTSFTDANIPVILGTILARAVDGSGYPITISSSLMQRILDINEMNRALAASNSLVYLWDGFQATYDPAYPYGHALHGTPLVGFTEDGVHPISYGSYLAAAPLKTLLGNMVSTTPWFSGATNLFTNPTFTGTGGTVNQGMTGTAPTSWVVRNVLTTGQNITGTSSVSNGVVTLNLTSDGAGSSASNTETIEFLPLSSPTGLTNGAWYQMVFKVSVSNNSGKMIGALRSQLRNSTTGQFGHAMENASTDLALDPFPHQDYTQYLVTEAVQWNTGNSQTMRLYAQIIENKAGSCTIQISEPRYFEVTNPQVLFPYTP